MKLFNILRFMSALVLCIGAFVTAHAQGTVRPEVAKSLQAAQDAHIAAIASKSLKEPRYHFQHARDWLIRFGDGTAESHHKAQAALQHLMPYTQEFWTLSAHEQAAEQTGLGSNAAALQADWNAIVDAALNEATLKRPAEGGFVPTGKQGIHSEHLGFVLAEMQSLARAHPEATW